MIPSAIPSTVRRFVALLLLCGAWSGAVAQNYARLDVEVAYGSQPLDPEKPMVVLDTGDTLEITLLRWFFQGKRPQSRTEIVFVDYLKQQSFSVPTDVQEWQFGLDSALHMSTVKAGPLDPANAMHFSGNKGMIHFRLEGILHRKDHSVTDIVLAIGGFTAPFNTIHRLPAKKNTSTTLTYALDLEPLMSYCRESLTYTIMRPCEEGTILSRLIAQNFRLLP